VNLLTRVVGLFHPRLGRLAGPLLGFICALLAFAFAGLGELFGQVQEFKYIGFVAAACLYAVFMAIVIADNRQRRAQRADKAQGRPRLY
jgi:uncharacterized membrane protein YhhN